MQLAEFFLYGRFKRDVVNNVPAAQSSISSLIPKSNPKKSVYGPIVSNVHSFAADIVYASVAMTIWLPSNDVDEPQGHDQDQ